MGACCFVLFVPDRHAAAPVFETIADEWQEDLPAPPGKFSGAAAGCGSADGFRHGEGLCISAPITAFPCKFFPAGDRDATLREVTGFEADQLTLVDTDQGDPKAGGFRLTCAGEAGAAVPGAVFDDGFSHHYVLAQTDADSAGVPFRGLGAAVSVLLGGLILAQDLPTGRRRPAGRCPGTEFPLCPLKPIIQL